MPGVCGPSRYSCLLPLGSTTTSFNRGRGSGSRSQASPVSWPCSSAVSLLDRPQKMTDECRRCAVATMLSNTSLVGTTTRETCLPSFSATATTDVNNSCSYLLNTSEVSTTSLPLKEC